MSAVVGPRDKSGLVPRCSVFTILTEPFVGDNFLVARQPGYYKFLKFARRLPF
jgi:hypothetical protein